MSLSTTYALECAIAYLADVKLCLLDATEANISDEVEQIESITHYLKDKLAEVGGEE